MLHFAVIPEAYNVQIRLFSENWLLPIRHIARKPTLESYASKLKYVLAKLNQRKQYNYVLSTRPCAIPPVLTCAAKRTSIYIFYYSNFSDVYNHRSIISLYAFLYDWNHSCECLNNRLWLFSGQDNSTMREMGEENYKRSSVFLPWNAQIWVKSNLTSRK